MFKYFIRFISFSSIVWLISYGLYVVPIVYYLSLIGYFTPFYIQILVSILIAGLIFIYLQTKITFFPLKFFVYFGMAVGFYGLILSIIVFISSFIISPNYGVLFLPIALLAILTYGYLNSRKIYLKKIEISTKKKMGSQRLAFISDVHLGSQSISHLSDILSLIRDQNVDAILIGGDLIDSSSFNLDELEILKLESIPIFYVTGNHEYYLKDSVNKIKALNKVNISNIDNKSVEFNNIKLIGLGDNQSINQKNKYLNSLSHNDLFTILLVHKPSLWPDAKKYSDLMLSGHTHAGQLFPFHYLVKLQFPYYYGLYKKDDSYAYVSSGCGCWGPRLRIGSQNEIVIININKNDDK